MATNPHDGTGLPEWVDTWRNTGRLLDAERAARLAAMTEDEARRMSLALLDLWRPGARDEEGAELVAHQRLFATARLRSSRS